jgi:amino acid adenylation domain-containing protein
MRQEEYIISENLGLDAIFENVVKTYHNQIAVKFGEKSLCFSELNKLSNQYAHYLIENGLKSGEGVGICFNRSIELVITIFALLKIGSIGVFIDPDLPKERIEYMLNHARVNKVITNQKKLKTPLDLFEIHITDLEQIRGINIKHSIIPTNHIDEVAFIFYTSGSSGQPKGVKITHGGILNDSHPDIALPSLTSEDCLLMTSPTGSIRLTGELFYPLFSGSKIVILEDKDSTNVHTLIEKIVDERVTVVFVVPTLLRSLLETDEIKKCESLKYVQSMGEKLPLELRQKFNEKLNASLVNVYGQTETGMCTIHYCKPLDNNSYNIVGTNVKNRSILILAEDMTPVKVGEIGEIYISGKYLSNGYFDDNDFTNERFILHPSTGLTIYKTGDTGRITKENQLEYLGRIDQVVKIGGMRVSLIEVETLLLAFYDVRDVAVKAVNNMRNEINLVAVVEMIENVRFSNSTWRNRLIDKVASYMIPNQFIQLEKLPKLMNGKLDHQLISQIIKKELNKENSTGFLTNTTGSELAKLWSHILSVDLNKIGPSTSFLELGGNSILAANCVVEMEKLYGVEIDINFILGNDLESIAMYLEKNNK